MSVSMEKVSELIDKAVREATGSLKREFEKTTSSLKADLVALQAENTELRCKITNVERTIEKNEQYNRKTSLILGGAGVPLPPTDHIETTSETRATVTKIIKEKLNVNMQGAIVACHRLRNKKRVLVKFQDMEDREAVYQARFEQQQDPNTKVIIHENLTESRANMIKQLGQMREKGNVVNYHTKNGMIYARDSKDKRYSLIEPWFSEGQIIETIRGAAGKGNPTQSRNPEQERLMRSQTLENIPPGRVARQAADLSEFVINSTRKTRSQSQATGGKD